MAKGQLTAQEVRSKSKITGLHRVAPGLYLRVRGGSAIWTLRHTSNKHTRERSLGPLGTLSLADAVAKAAEVRAKIKRGEPVETALPTATALSVANSRDTFREVAEMLWESLKAGWTNPKHAEQWRNTLETYAYPKLGEKCVADITTQDVFDVLTANGLWAKKHETATRVRQRIEAVLAAAKAKGLREGANAAVWADNLKPLLPKIPKKVRVKHHAALPWRDMPALIAQLRERPHMSSWALQVTILTALRTGSVIGARWREFHLDAQVPVWIIPKERMKNKQEFHVPLSTQAVQVLRGIPRMNSSDVVFWGGPTRKDKPGKPKGTIGPISNMAMLELLRGMRERVTVHGCRSSFRDWAADATSHPAEVVEMAMAHAIKNDVEAAYRRTDLFDRRLILMQDWADFLDGATERRD